MSSLLLCRSGGGSTPQGDAAAKAEAVPFCGGCCSPAQQSPVSESSSEDRSSMHPSSACMLVSCRAQLSVAHRTPYRPIQMTVPETPSPEVLMQQQQAVVGATTRRGGPGRHVSDTTPSKGRVAKAQRVDDGSMGGEADAIRLRWLVLGQPVRSAPSRVSVQATRTTHHDRPCVWRQCRRCAVRRPWHVQRRDQLRREAVQPHPADGEWVGG